MEESSAAVNAVTLLDHSKGSSVICGDYNTCDEKFTLPNYMTHAPPSTDVISKVYVPEEINKTGDGGNLGSNGFDMCNLDNAMRDMETSRSRYLLVEDN